LYNSVKLRVSLLHSWLSLSAIYDRLSKLVQTDIETDFEKSIVILDRPVVHLSRISIPNATIMSSVAAAYVQTDFFSLDYYERTNAIYSLRPIVEDQVATFFTEKIKELASKGVNVICFPELTCPRSKIEDLKRVVNETGIYVIVGSYHDPVQKKNIAILLAGGEVFEQEKFMKSELEDIEPKNHAIVHIYDSSIGKFAIMICYDIEHPELTNILRREIRTKGGLDFIFNPSCHPSPERSKSVADALFRAAGVAVIFANNHIKGGSFINDGTVETAKNLDKNDRRSIDLQVLRDVRPKAPKMVTTQSI
jgi:predicted amidohydrolase